MLDLSTQLSGSERGDIDYSLSKSLRRFLGQVVSNATSISRNSYLPENLLR